jgi:predicted DNA-binding transcriptional regulator AlpA
MNAEEGSEPRLWRLPEVLERTGLTKKTLYRLMATPCADGNGFEFPNSRDISAATVAWKSIDVIGWINSRPSTRRPGRGGN